MALRTALTELLGVEHPVILAPMGGVSGGALAAALALGAAGALIGTRFYAAEEALGHEAAKRRLVDGTGDETLRTTVFDIVRGRDWPAAYTGRAFDNDLSATWHGREQSLNDVLDRETERYAEAHAAGDVSRAVVFAGEAVDLITDIEPAGRILARLVADAEATLARVQTNMR